VEIGESVCTGAGSINPLEQEESSQERRDTFYYALPVGAEFPWAFTPRVRFRCAGEERLLAAEDGRWESGCIVFELASPRPGASYEAHVLLEGEELPLFCEGELARIVDHSDSTNALRRPSATAEEPPPAAASPVASSGEARWEDGRPMPDPLAYEFLMSPASGELADA